MPIPVTDLDLLLFAAEALDPEATATLEARLRASPALSLRFQGVAGQDPVRLPPSPRWRIPPPGTGLAAHLARSRAMAGDRIRIGSVFGVRFSVQEQPEALGVVVLRQEEGDWVVLSPAHPDQAVALVRVGRPEAGQLRVDLVARPPLGPQRWAIALHALPLPVGAALDPWAPVRAAVEAGAVVVGSVEVDVALAESREAVLAASFRRMRRSDPTRSVADQC